MDSSLAVVLSLVITVNPVAICWSNGPTPVEKKQLRIAVFAFLSGCLFGLGALAGGIFDLLEISSPTFRLGAALVIGLSCGKWLVAPKFAPIRGNSNGDSLHIILHMLSPGPVFAAIAGGGDAGILPLLLACTILLFTLGVATLVTVVNINIRDAALRLFGGSGIVLAVIIGLDAARTV